MDKIAALKSVKQWIVEEISHIDPDDISKDEKELVLRRILGRIDGELLKDA